MIEDREPCATYAQAVWKLVFLLSMHGAKPSLDAEYSDAELIIADMFWVNVKRVRADVLKYWREV